MKTSKVVLVCRMVGLPWNQVLSSFSSRIVSLGNSPHLAVIFCSGLFFGGIASFMSSIKGLIGGCDKVVGVFGFFSVFKLRKLKGLKLPTKALLC